MTSQADKIIIALDTDNLVHAEEWALSLAPLGVRFKIGMELFYAAGPQIIARVQKYGPVFLDLKLHDIPQTMAKTARVLAGLGVWMFNVHTSAGPEALQAVRETIDDVVRSETISHHPKVIGVTVLTSTKDLHHLHPDLVLQDTVGSLIAIASCYLDGVVCAASDIRYHQEIKKKHPNFLFVTPGIRGLEDHLHDQKRVMSPSEALAAGSDYLVIGRPVTQAKNPRLALEKIIDSLRS